MNSNPLNDIGTALQSVENPVRYLGGEFGQIIKKDAHFTFAISFPDVYEIGMSNQAIKILYSGLNALEGIACERVFAPESDFETLLKAKNLPLYTLETGRALHDVDIIGFSIGYELGITGVFSILDCGKIPLKNSERTENHPIVIAGGCGVTNPVPFAAFFDAVFIGEAENELFVLVEKAAALKKSGAKRADILKIIVEHPAVWIPGKKAVAAHYANFGKEPAIPAWFPVPAIKVVQGHGVVEIMRGCPNGCRFCHAGIFYRPQRVKQIDAIIAETDRLVHEAGCHEISLSSLSSGDYDEIGLLLDTLNEQYAGKNVSFQLPSLKVNSFTLPILEKLAEVRKGGLTFAIETPVDAWQLSLNKEVYEERIVDIILAAKKRGWSKAKFYFMIGLPIESGEKREESEIVDFMLKIQAQTRIQCTVNVGTFIPKPHTPYERVRQLSPDEAEEKLRYIRYNLPKGRFKVSTHGGFTSCLEGIISRGDEYTGELLLKAYNAGCRLDAWENHLKKETWLSVFTQNSFNILTALREREVTEKLPWHEVSLGVTSSFLQRECERSKKQLLTKKCSFPCTESCGVCNKSQHVSNKIYKEQKLIHNKINSSNKTVSIQKTNIEIMHRVVFSFSKRNGAEYIPHLSLVETFLKAFLRSNLSIIYTAGFNPIPRFELANSLSIGIQSEEEIASCLLYEPVSDTEFISLMNTNLPKNISINYAHVFPVSNKRKRESLASSLWGAEYVYDFNTTAQDVLKFIHLPETEQFLQKGFTVTSKKVHAKIAFNSDRPFRNHIVEYFKLPLYEIVAIQKVHSFACFTDVLPEQREPVSYFDVYKAIAQINAQLILNE